MRARVIPCGIDQGREGLWFLALCQSEYYLITNLNACVVSKHALQNFISPAVARIPQPERSPLAQRLGLVGGDKLFQSLIRHGVIVESDGENSRVRHLAVIPHVSLVHDRKTGKQ